MAQTGKIAGTVVDKKTGRALAFVNIAIPEAKTGALSDSKGEFLIGNVPPGTYTLRAQVARARGAVKRLPSLAFRLDFKPPGCEPRPAQDRS